MTDFFFVIKCLVFTVILVFAMQIKIGNETIESQSMTWLHESSAVHSLQLVADGAIKSVRHGLNWASNYFDTKIGANDKKRPGSRLQNLAVKRSDVVEREQELKRRAAEEAAEAKLDTTASEIR